MIDNRLNNKQNIINLRVHERHGNVCNVFFYAYLEKLYITEILLHISFNFAQFYCLIAQFTGNLLKKCKVLAAFERV